MLKEDIELVRHIAREEIKLAFGDATPLAKQQAKDAAVAEAKAEKEAADAAKITADAEKEAAKAEKGKR